VQLSCGSRQKLGRAQCSRRPKRSMHRVQKYNGGMSKPVSKTTVLDDGLRYKSKVSGSPFGGSSFSGNASKSCFLCGKHRPQSEMMTRKLIGKAQAVCSPKC
jgi:hypothetical protein